MHAAAISGIQLVRFNRELEELSQDKVWLDNQEGNQKLASERRLRYLLSGARPGRRAPARSWASGWPHRRKP